MKFKISFLLFLILIFAFSPLNSKAAEQTTIAKLIQQIEIIKFEIAVFQSLISNFQLNQGITAKSYLAVDLSNNSILLEKNSNQTYIPASITKLMTAVIALENTNENQTITLTEKMLEPAGQSPCLFLGLNINAKNLLKASLTQSANDASEALSYFIGKEKFIELMNQKAKELNMSNTVFYDVHGLNPANKTTASDLLKLLSYIQKNHPEILSTTKENDFWLPDASGTLLKFQNVNNFYPLPEFIGGKTGYLPEAKQTLASIFNVNGKQIAIVLLYSNNRQADAFSIIKQIKK